jgi:hypothetical protein
MNRKGAMNNSAQVYLRNVRQPEADFIAGERQVRQGKRQPCRRLDNGAGQHHPHRAHAPVSGRALFIRHDAGRGCAPAGLGEAFWLFFHLFKKWLS